MGLCIREGVSTNSLGSMITHLIIKLLRYQLVDHKLIRYNSGAFFHFSSGDNKAYNALQLG